ADHLLAPDGQRPLIIIASNRGPYSFKQKENGDLAYQRSSGGLVTALGALAEKHAVLWVAGAAGKADQLWAEQNHHLAAEIEGILLRLVQPGKRRYEQYYNVIANPLLWFIQHQLWDIPRTPSITRDTWKAWRKGYVAVNKLFADEIIDAIGDTSRPVIILPQDYHLYLVQRFLRETLGFDVQIQPFIHIPWPGPDAWRILPEEMRTTILTGLLASDRIGFQTRRDAFNFVQCCRFFLPDAHSQGSRDTIYYEGRRIEAKAYPISVDVAKVQELIEDPQIPLLKSQLLNFVGDKKLILRVDRIEPSKNILRGLEAYRALLHDHPEHRSKVQMLALLVPSRMEVEQYQNYFQDIMAQAGIINAEYNDAHWEPVRIMVGENYYRALAAMQLYDVLLVNPIADGMNLVAKEGALINQRDGVIMLSEYAGAYYELAEHAVIVSPFDIHSMSEAMHAALTMSVDERHRRAEALRQLVQSADVKSWFYAQIEDALTAMSSHSKNASTPEIPSSMASA
ncbi:MAG: trehalose-6-phosphate synthase, partial [Chloroflexi bacterium]